MTFLDQHQYRQKWEQLLSGNTKVRESLTSILTQFDDQLTTFFKKPPEVEYYPGSVKYEWSYEFKNGFITFNIYGTTYGVFVSARLRSKTRWGLDRIPSKVIQLSPQVNGLYNVEKVIALLKRWQDKLPPTMNSPFIRLTSHNTTDDTFRVRMKGFTSRPLKEEELRELETLLNKFAKK